MTDPQSPPRAPDRRLGAIVVPVLCLAALLSTLAVPAGAADSDRVAKLLQTAEKRFKFHDYERAAKYYAQADKAADGRSLPAVEGLTLSSIPLLRFDDAVEAAKRWVAMADTPQSRFDAYSHLGIALHRKGLTERWGPVVKPRRHRRSEVPPTKADPTAGDDALRAAADAFRRADEVVGDDGKPHHVLLNLADTLSWLDQDEEALAVLDTYAAAGGTDPYADDIRCWTSFSDRRKPREERDEDDPDAPKQVGTESEVQAPVKVYAPPPRYPESARVARLQAVVIVEAIVNKQGTVDCVRPLLGNPFPLAYAAMTAVKSWRFEPALLDGEPEDVFYNLTINFTLR